MFMRTWVKSFFLNSSFWPLYGRVRRFPITQPQWWRQFAYKCCLLETGHLCSWNLNPVLGAYQLLNIPAGTRIKYLLEKNHTKLAVIELLKNIHISLVLIWVQGWFLAGMWQVYITWHWRRYNLWYYFKPLPSRYLSMLVWNIGLDTGINTDMNTGIKYQTSLVWPKSATSLRPVLAGSNLRECLYTRHIPAQNQYWA
jgi:hypothetical protein